MHAIYHPACPVWLGLAVSCEELGASRPATRGESARRRVCSLHAASSASNIASPRPSRDDGGLKARCMCLRVHRARASPLPAASCIEVVHSLQGIVSLHHTDYSTLPVCTSIPFATCLPPVPAECNSSNPIPHQHNTPSRG